MTDPTQPQETPGTPVRKRGRGRQVRNGLILGAVVIVAIVVIQSASGPSPNYTVSVQDSSGASATRPASGWPLGGSVAVVDPAHVKVYGQVRNTGKASGTPSCVIQARSADYSDTGTDGVSPTSPIRPGGIWSFSDVITITNQGAANVTHVSVSC